MRRRFRKLRKHYAASGVKHVRRVRRVVRHPLFTIPVATFMVLMALTFAGIVVLGGGTPKLKASDSNIVIISHDHQEQAIPTNAKTVGDLLKRLNIKLNEGDVVEPALNTEIVSDNFRVNVYRAVPVTIVDGAQKRFVYSAASTPRSIVKQAGVQVYPEDELTLLPADNFLAESSIGERVVIQRSWPITVNLYGTFVPMRTRATTVQEFLKEKKIKLENGDSVMPTPKTPISTSSQIFVTHKGVQIQTAEEPIEMPVQTVMDRSLSFGATAVRQQGAPGKKLVTYQVDTKNGARVRLQDVTIQDPVPQIVAKGSYVNIPADKTSIMAAAGISQSDYMYVDYVISHESHWNPAAVNGSGCTGLGQSCPGSKLASACPSWQTDAICQLRFFSGYANSRYGGWAGAYNKKIGSGWW